MDWLADLANPLFLAGTLAVAALCLILTLFYSLFKRPYFASFNLKLLSITLPKKISSSSVDPLKEIGLSEQLFSALSSIGRPFIFELAVHHAGESIHFYLAVPRSEIEFATEQIHGLFPEAKVREENDYNIFNPHGESQAAFLSLKESFFLPVRSYQEAKVDTFSPVLSTLSRLEEVGEGAAIQILVRPADSLSRKKLLNAIISLKKGFKFSEVLRTDFFNLKDVGQAMSSAKKDQKNKEIIVDNEAISILESKAAHPLLSVIVRIISSSGTADRAADVLDAIGGSFSQFSAPKRNSFMVIKPRDQKKVFFNYSFREWNPKESVILNSQELASIFHLPVSSTEVPRLLWLKIKESEPPPNLPGEGLAIGESAFRGESKLIRVKDDDRRRHLYIIGQTGTGKSYLMLNMAAQDIKDGKGICLIDPHGDLVNDLLSLVPKERVNDVIVFDPGDMERPLGLNMLEFNPSRPEEKTFIVNEMQAIFNRLFSNETMGPMFEQYMRNALLLLMEDSTDEPATLIEIPRIFTDSEYRKHKISRVKNPVVVDFWEKEAVKTSGEQGLANMTPYVTSKFNNFIANDYMRPVIGQFKSSFNFRQVMDEGKILLINLSKGKVGEINASLLGMIFTGRLLLAALSRSDTESESRRDFYLYIDEFQNFTTDSISVILSEARKYHLNLILAHQFIAQLSEQIKGAVFGNVGTLAMFRVGADDAEYLKKQVEPQFGASDLINMDNRNAILKLLIDGEPARAFNMKTMQIEKGSVEVREKLKELSRLTYGRELAAVEADILRRLRA